jgi:hypothetical protein
MDYGIDFSLAIRTCLEFGYRSPTDIYLKTGIIFDLELI